MKLNPPFSELNLNGNNVLLLFRKEEQKPNTQLFHEDLQDLWSCSLATADFAYIGKMTINQRIVPFCVDLNDKNLPVYSIDARWSEQEICLIHPQLKGFYGFLRLLKEHQKDWQSKLPSLLQSLPKSVEFPEFWNCLKQ